MSSTRAPRPPSPLPCARSRAVLPALVLQLGPRAVFDQVAHDLGTAGFDGEKQRSLSLSAGHGVGACDAGAGQQANRGTGSRVSSWRRMLRTPGTAGPARVP